MHDRSDNGQNAFESLVDAIENYMVSGDNGLLYDYIESMPDTRESVNELLNACSGYDLLEIYIKLLVDCRDILTAEERNKLKLDYKRIFSVPLPGEIE